MSKDKYGEFSVITNERQMILFAFELNSLK